MSTDLQSPPEQSLSALLSGIVTDAQKLFRQQTELFRQEVREDVRKTQEAAVPMALGLCLAGMGGLLLLVTAALGLWAAGLQLWVSFLIVGAAAFLIGGALFAVGKQKFDSFNPLPDKSAEALKENLEWLTKPK
jgi:hypothetical protein